MSSPHSSVAPPPNETSPSELLAEKLLGGWTMLGENCGRCGKVPLMRDLKGKDFCVCCGGYMVPPSGVRTPGETPPCEAATGYLVQIPSSTQQTAASEKDTPSSSPTTARMTVEGEWGLNDTEAYRLQCCSSKLKREGLSLLLEAHEKQPATDPLAKAKDDRHSSTPKAERPKEIAKAEIPPPSRLVKEASQPRDAILKTTSSLLLQKIERYNGALQRPQPASLDGDKALLGALYEALRCLAAVESLISPTS